MRSPRASRGSGVIIVGVVACLAVCAVCAACAPTEPQVEDPTAAEDVAPAAYFGQMPPGSSREVFAPGIVSTIARESGLTISPNGRDVVFSVGLPGISAILHVPWESDRWGEPRVAPFSGHYDDWEPVFSPSGRRLYFVSSRPTGAPGGSPNDRNLWYAERTDSGWGEPVEVGAPVNSPELPEGYGSLTRDGSIYFFRYEDEAENLTEIYRSECRGDQCLEPEKLGSAINSHFHDWDPFIAPDESYLIFSSPGRPDSFGSADLYISFRAPDGTWTEAVNMGQEVNGAGTEICPFVSADGKYLFFEAASGPRSSAPASSPRPSRPPKGTPLTHALIMEMASQLGESEVESYWIDASVIDELRQQVMGG